MYLNLIETFMTDKNFLFTEVSFPPKDIKLGNIDNNHLTSLRKL